MTTDNDDKVLNQQIDRAFRSQARPQTPAALDAKVLQYAHEHAPSQGVHTESAPRYNRWMPATAAVCITGVAVLIALPLAPPPLLQQEQEQAQVQEQSLQQDRSNSENDFAVASGQQVLAAEPSTMAHNKKAKRSVGERANVQEHKEENAQQGSANSNSATLTSEALRDELRLEEVVIADAIPSAQKLHLRLMPDVYKSLKDLLEAHAGEKISANSARSELHADAVSDSVAGFAEAPKTNKEQLSFEQRYQQLRTACDCDLPKNLLLAKKLLESGAISIETPSKSE